MDVNGIKNIWIWRIQKHCLRIFDFSKFNVVAYGIHLKQTFPCMACSIKGLFLKILHNSQKSTCDGVIFDKVARSLS